jgi:hypothetical protein
MNGEAIDHPAGADRSVAPIAGPSTRPTPSRSGLGGRSRIGPRPSRSMLDNLTHAAPNPLTLWPRHVGNTFRTVRTAWSPLLRLLSTSDTRAGGPYPGSANVVPTSRTAKVQE